MTCGLSDADLAYIVDQIASFSCIEKAVIFGSRAKGNFKRGSDIDIAIFGEGITFTVVANLHAKLEDEGPLPYYIDVVDYTHLNHEALKAHIDRVGIVIFDRFATRNIQSCNINKSDIK